MPTRFAVVTTTHAIETLTPQPLPNLIKVFAQSLQGLLDLARIELKPLNCHLNSLTVQTEYS